HRMPSRVPKTFQGCGRADDVGHQDGPEDPESGVLLRRAVGARARELDHLPRHVADYPGVMARRNLVGIAAANVHLTPVLNLDMQMPTERRAEVTDLAGSRADLRRDVDRPPPPGLELHPADGRLVELDHGHPAATQVAHLLRRVKVLSLQPRHSQHSAATASGGMRLTPGRSDP